MVGQLHFNLLLQVPHHTVIPLHLLVQLKDGHFRVVVETGSARGGDGSSVRAACVDGGGGSVVAVGVGRTAEGRRTFGGKFLVNVFVTERLFAT